MKITRIQNTVINNHGSTLLEVMIVSAILLGALVSNMSLSGQSANSMNVDNKFATATQLGSNIMEDLLIRDPADPTMAPGVHVQNYDINQIPVASGGEFQVTWTISSDTPLLTVMRIDLASQIISAPARAPATLTTFRKQ
jgi:hypothetical protein